MKIKVFSYCFKLLLQFKKAFYAMIWLAFFYAFTICMSPYLIRTLINKIPKDHFSFSDVGWPIVSYLFLHIALVTSFRLHSYFVEIRMIPALRSHVISESMLELINKSYTHHQNHFSGQYSNKVTDLTQGIPEFLQLIMDQFLGLFFVGFVSVVTLWNVNSFFGSIMMGWIFVFLISSYFFTKILRYRSDEWTHQGTKISGVIVDTLSNILSIFLFSGKKHEKDFIAKETKNYQDAEVKLQWSYFWMWLYFGVSTFVLQIFNFYFLCKGKKEGWVTVGDFALVLTLSLSICNHMWRATKDFSQFTKLYGKITQALRSIQEHPDKIYNEKNIHVSSGEIRFNQVHFSYNDEVFFNNKSIVIQGGSKVGLVGFSGSGKTTFINLIMGLYKVESGSIFLDGQDISDVSIESISPFISSIPQDPILFKRTILENIRYGCFDATKEQIIQAAKKAHAHDFIMKFKNNYESVIGEVMLSGGQKQRIAIARAILKNAPLLIFDEATSQMDSVTEISIYEQIKNLIDGKTTLIIAHRLSTLLSMDRILVFDQGKIVQDGHHNDLIEKEGIYKMLWTSQNHSF